MSTTSDPGSSSTSTSTVTTAPPSSSFTYSYVLSDEPASSSPGTGLSNLRSRFRKTGGSSRRPVAGSKRDGEASGEGQDGQGEQGGRMLIGGSCIVQ
ncbi:uncharacterized protein H6S33_004366 [Morchella sextelata]|uniref:uncharacterized protein n=1 Tax=Morchella sextelata TaxID=1174677 RepID=UPI001D0429E2|nr:uncharacterized protein H6S33_004366 [Morchella sextelata]KAH0605909.1 hypothetical protein H6S33_004366 [Morchella sextelata]